MFIHRTYNGRMFKEVYMSTTLGILLKDRNPEALACLLRTAGDFLVGSRMYGALLRAFIMSSEMSFEDQSEAVSLLELELEDRKSARENQHVVASTGSSLARNFIYYLATAVFIFSSTVVMFLFFIEIPESNRDVVNFILGVLVGTGLTGIFNYFFGSSSGSATKSEDIRTIMNDRYE